MAVVTIRDLRKSFGPVEVLHGVSIDIAEGEFVVLVGPSGCGKSTLLRMLAGLEHVTSGEIRIGDRVVNDLPPKERDIAMVFQNYALYPHLTVAENMAFSLTLKGAPKAEITARVTPAAEILGLTNLLERYPRQLSGGQRQRVAMGRAIVRDPQVFLFDEPLSNLDAKLRVSMRAEIKNLHQRLKTTTVYVTHDQIEAMTMADKIVVMHDGRVEQVGAPLDLYDAPANLFVAGFIGSPAMNMLTGRARRRAVRHRRRHRAAGPRASAAGGGAGRAGGLRPAARSSMHLGGEVPLRVEVVEPTGSETHVLGHIGATEVVGVFRERVRAQPGEEIRVAHRPRGDASLRRRARARASRPEGGRLRGRRPFGQIQSREQGGYIPMSNITRSDLLAGAAGLAAASTLGVPRLRAGADLHPRGGRRACACCAGCPS